MATKKTIKGRKASPAPRKLTTPLAKLLHDEKVVKILPESARSRPMSEWIERTGVSRQHFYMIVRGEQPFTERTLLAFADATRLTQKALVEAQEKSAKLAKVLA